MGAAGAVGATGATGAAGAATACGSFATSTMSSKAGPISGALGTRFGSKLPLAGGAAITSLGLFGLAFDHDSQFSVIAWAFVMSGGIGLAFAAMANLIVEAVPPAQTGEATGFNALVRSVGAEQKLLA